MYSVERIFLFTLLFSHFASKNAINSGKGKQNHSSFETVDRVDKYHWSQSTSFYLSASSVHSMVNLSLSSTFFMIANRRRVEQPILPFELIIRCLKKVTCSDNSILSEKLQ